MATGMRGRISARDACAKSEAIAELVFKAPFYEEARSVFCFVSVEGEVDTARIIRKALEDGKQACVPRTAPGGQMDAVPITLEAFSRAQAEWPRHYGIPEPPASFPRTDPQGLSLVFAPSLAVDTEGYRLGHGGGYYDRFAAQCKTSKTRPLFVAIQFADLLVTTQLPREPHDMPVDFIVTEEGVLAIPSCA